ncbi:MAG: ABC transporter permease [Dehalococcoidia bacterium]|jgi:peptide/nickel transport system permease protein|nr:ABC transporter permease [Dehalococcoidia bacterium]
MQFTEHVRHNRLALAGLALFAAFVLGALLAPLLAPHDPWAHFEPFLSPTATHLLGTDDVGRDILSELITGARVSLTVGLLSGLLAVSLGVLVGLLAGFRRGRLDEALMGLTDVVLVIPALPLVILVSVYLGPGLWHTILIIGLVFWPSTARVIRSQVLSVRQSGYVEAARALGAGDGWLMRRHVLPNVLPLVLAKLVLTVAAAMLMEASLSFLGLGDPTTKSWGMMLHYAFARGGFIRELWWWYLPPGLCIGLCIFGLTLVSFGIEERSDPRLRRALDR